MAVKPFGGATHRKILKELQTKPTYELDALNQQDDDVWWAEQNLQTEKGDPIEFENHPYLETIYEDWHPHMIYYKAAQMGLTQTAVGKMVRFATRYNVNIIYTFPTKTDVEEFSQSRFRRIIDGSPRLASLIGTDNAHYKEIGGSKAFFRGSFSERQAISIPSDLNIHDELDFSKDDIKDLYVKRLSASIFQYEWEFSTPTIPDFGIHALWKQSDRRVWLVRCHRCNTRQQVKWEGYKRSNLRELKTPGGSHLRWIYACWKCGKELDRSKGIWVALRPSKSDIHGYHIPQTIAPWISAERLKKEEQAAKEKGRFKIFVNFNLGRAYSVGANLITRELIRSRMFIYPQSIWNSDRFYLGVDQGDVLHWILKVYHEGRKVVVRFGKVKDFKELDIIMNDYKVGCCVIDAQPNKHSAKEFRDRFDGRVFLCYYRDKQPHELKEMSDENELKATKNEEHYAISVDRTESLDSSAADWINGRAWLNSNPARLVTGTPEYEFATQMTNLKRDEEEDKHGNMVGVWKKTGADHYRHADNYAKLAFDIIGTGRYEIKSGGQNTAGYGDPTPQWKQLDNGLVVPGRVSREVKDADRRQAP